jgi:hypothetical protein
MLFPQRKGFGVFILAENQVYVGWERVEGGGGGALNYYEFVGM